MQNILTIFRKELAGYFNSAIAYIVIVLFLILTGLWTWFLWNSILIAGVVTMRPAFDIIPYTFLVLIPAITMRSFSEEKKTGTIELLLTRPITDMEIILGKFLGGLALTLIAILPTLLYVVGLYLLAGPGPGKIDLGPIFGAYVGLIFLSAILVGIGIFCSSLTENQIVAFLMSFFVILFFLLIKFALVFLPPSVASIFEYLSVNYHYASISRGVFDSRDLIYYFSGVVILLLLTRTSLEKRKW